MTEKKEVYKCSVCGNIVEILHEGMGQLVCCNKPMDQQTENTVDATTEKHVPIITKTEDGATIRVGSVDHPMDDEHHIEWIEILVGDYVNRKYLKPGDDPEAYFYVHKQPGAIVRSYCNLHGLWKA